MDRKPKEKAASVDLLKPYTPSVLKDDECFGNMWDPQHKDCSICADIEVCGLLYQQTTIAAKKRNFEKENGPTLDMTDFSRVDLKKLEAVAAQYQKNKDPMTLNELMDAVASLAKTKDIVAVREFLKRELPLTNMTMQNNEIHVQDSNNSRHK